MSDAMRALVASLQEHADHPWTQVGLCVYCDECKVRLYQGDLPDEKRTIPRCADGAHDWDEEQGLGFYFICKTCGVKEWPE